MSDNTPELESLLAGPYFWSTPLYYEFFHDVSNFVINGDNDLKDPLNAGSKQVFGASNFVEMMGVEYWDILKCDEKGKDRYNLDNPTSRASNEKKKLLVVFLKLLRDKDAHIVQYNDTVKEQLNTLTVNGRTFEFFRKDDNGKYQLNKHQYISFWNYKFPKLVPYLWEELYTSKDQLSKFYPDDNINMEHFKNTRLDLTGYVEGLRNALTCDMENGNVLRRFKGLGNCLLEFRGFHNLDKKEVITMVVNPRSNVLMSTSHSSSPTEVMEYNGNAPGTEKLILIFTADRTDFEVWRNFKSLDCRVVIFCDPESLTTENIEEVVGKFKTVNRFKFEIPNSPIKGCELSEDKQKWVFEHGRVLVQGRKLKIKEIFSDSSTMSGSLSGNVLNRLLKNEKSTLFGNYKYPAYNGVYIERKLYSSKNDEKLEHIFVAVNQDIKILSKFGNTQVFNNIKHLEEEIDSVKLDCEFILLKEHENISNEIIEKCDTALYSRSVRFIDHYYNVVRLGITRVIDSVETDKKSRRRLAETEFLKIIHHNNIKTFFFRAESGMGKSKLLISLGKQIENSLVLFCSFRKFVDILQTEVGTKECTKTNVKCVILEILRCKDECERKVIWSWLDRKGGAGTKVELQLDAVDEVPSEQLELASKALKIIENDFDSVRLWITSSRIFPNEMEEINFVEWNISPFSKIDKITFFDKSISRKVTEGTERLTFGQFRHAGVRIIKFTERFNITAQKELTDYPLFCSMIAELYGDKLVEQSTFPLPLNQFDLYDSLSKKKFDSMIKAKIGKELDKSDNDFKLLEDIYMNVHKYFALVHLFPKLSSKFKKPSALKFLTEENICKMRIMTSIEPPAFVHLSYAHFFVALFIIDEMKTGELDILCSKETFDSFLLSGAPDESNLNTLILLWEFVNTYLSKIKDWSTFKWLENHKKEKHCNVKYNSTFVTSAIDNRLWDLARLLINVGENEMDSVECNKILHMLISRQAPSKYFIEMCEMLRFDNQRQLLICSVQNGRYDTAKYLINTWFENGNKLFDEIAEMREDGGGIFHCIVDQIKGTNFVYSKKCLAEKIPFEFNQDAKGFIMFVHETNPEEMKRKDNRGQNFLLALPVLPTLGSGVWSGDLLNLKKFLVEDLNADVNEISSDGESILCLGHVIEPPTLVQRDFVWRDGRLYHETLDFVASKNFAHINLKSKVSGLTPLGEAVQFLGSDLKIKILILFQKLGANFNELDKDGNTILHYAIKYFDYPAFILALIRHGSKIDVQNGEGLCSLCFADKEGKALFKWVLNGELELGEDETCLSNCIIINEYEGLSDLFNF